MSDSSQARKAFLDKAVSRLDFLKQTGVGVAGAFVALTFGGAVSVKAQDGRELRLWALPTGALVHDPNRCVACKRCEYACTAVNDGKVSSYISRIKITRNQNYGPNGVSSAYARADGQQGNFRIVGETCRQCQDPACGNACPIGAIVADGQTGARVINTKRCVGCGACEDACPFGMAVVDREDRHSTKCTTCGGDPTCAKNCPTGALKLYPYAEAEKLFWGSDAVSGATA